MPGPDLPQAVVAEEVGQHVQNAFFFEDVLVELQRRRGRSGRGGGLRGVRRSGGRCLGLRPLPYCPCPSPARARPPPLTVSTAPTVSDTFEGKGPQTRPQRRLGRRLEGVAEAVGGQLLSVTNAIEARTCRRGHSGWVPWRIPSNASLSPPGPTPPQHTPSAPHGSSPTHRH